MIDAGYLIECLVHGIVVALSLVAAGFLASVGWHWGKSLFGKE